MDEILFVKVYWVLVEKNKNKNLNALSVIWHWKEAREM